MKVHLPTQKKAVVHSILICKLYVTRVTNFVLHVIAVVTERKDMEKSFTKYDASSTCNNWVADALSSGIFTKHLVTKSIKSSLHFSGFLNVGGGLVGIMKIAYNTTNEEIMRRRI